MQRRSLKTRILDHAELRLLEQGYRGMRVDELARDVGISKRTLYELFRTKEDMAREALERILDDLIVKIDRAMLEQPDHAEQLRMIIRLLGERFANARQPFYRDLETTPTLVELVDAARTQTFERIERVLHAGVASGRFRADLDPHCVRVVLMATLDFLQRQGQERMSIEDACEGLYDLLARGLLATA
ncbi:TetR/AcrR family transcriptional regulator [Nannocystaceae bacterium ST9]